MRYARIGVYVVLVAMFVGSLWLTEHRFAQALHDQCEQANNGRDDLRHAFSDVLTDNLVKAADVAPDPARVERYRDNLLADLEIEFPDRKC